MKQWGEHFNVEYDGRYSSIDYIHIYVVKDVLFICQHYVRAPREPLLRVQATTEKHSTSESVLRTIQIAVI